MFFFLSSITHFGNHQLGVKVPFRLGTLSEIHSDRLLSRPPAANVAVPLVAVSLLSLRTAGLAGKMRMICRG